MTQPVSSNSSFSWLGLFLLIGLVLGAVCIGSAMAQQPPYLPALTPIPQPIVVQPVPVVHVTGCQCQNCIQTVVPQPFCPQPVVPVVVYPPQPTYFGEVDGFKTSGSLRCYNSHATEMGAHGSMPWVSSPSSMGSYFMKGRSQRARMISLSQTRASGLLRLLPRRL